MLNVRIWHRRNFLHVFFSLFLFSNISQLVSYLMCARKRTVNHLHHAHRWHLNCICIVRIRVHIRIQKNFAWDFVIIRHLIYANVYFFRSFVISFRLKLDCSVCICIVTAVLYSNDGNPMASSKEYLQAWTDVAIKKRRKCKSIHIQILKVLVEAAATTHKKKPFTHSETRKNSNQFVFFSARSPFSCDMRTNKSANLVLCSPIFQVFFSVALFNLFRVLQPVFFWCSIFFGVPLFFPLKMR